MSGVCLDLVFKALRQAETIGRPLGSDIWLKMIEEKTGLRLKQKKRGPKKKDIDKASKSKDNN